MNGVGLAIGGVLALVIVIAIAWLAIDNANLRAEIATVNSNYSVAKEANQQCATTVAVANAAVKSLKDAAQKQQDKLDEAIKKAQPVVVQYHARKSAIAKEKVSSDDCAGARQLIIKYMGGY